MEAESPKDPMEPLRREPESVRKVIEKVLILESERLYQEKPHINDDILRIVKEIIQ